MAYVLLLEELLPKNSFLFSIQQEAFFYFYFFNLIFPANMDLQGLPLTAWGWEEASPQATSFWSISFIGILASSSQEECSHCQRHNTRPKRPLKLTKSDSSCIRGYRAHRRGPPDLFSSGQAAAVVVGTAERGAGTDFDVVGERVFGSSHSSAMLPTRLNQGVADPRSTSGSHGQREHRKDFEYCKDLGSAAWAEHFPPAELHLC